MSAVRFLILVAFATKKVVVLITVKNICKTFPKCGFLTKDPNMRRENGALNACASIVSQHEENFIRARQSVSKNRNYFAETNKDILYHRDQNLMALDAHHQCFLLHLWTEILVLAWKFCLNTKKKKKKIGTLERVFACLWRGMQGQYEELARAVLT